MSDILSMLERYKVQKSANVEAFLKTLNAQIEALKKGSLNRRSWLKPEGNGYMIKLGKLEDEYQVTSKQDAIDVLSLIADNARSDEEFKALIEKAYGGAEPVKTRKPRKKAGE
ncbi:hypothetical protein [Shinella sp.]|uniref:hypothetical protein n=1 Tax=Shinella sp. TaxID=1870904 RepID=UPI004034FE17